MVLECGTRPYGPMSTVRPSVPGGAKGGNRGAGSRRLECVSGPCVTSSLPPSRSVPDGGSISAFCKAVCQGVRSAALSTDIHVNQTDGSEAFVFGENVVSDGMGVKLGR